MSPRVHSLSGQPFSVFDHPDGKNFLLISNQNFPSSNCCPLLVLSLYTSPVYLQGEISSILLMTLPLGRCRQEKKSPLSILFICLNKPAPSPSPSVVPSPSWWAALEQLQDVQYRPVKNHCARWTPLARQLLL